jgi:hypothetical protein
MKRKEEKITNNKQFFHEKAFNYLGLEKKRES